jgi:hypothetical protein
MKKALPFFACISVVILSCSHKYYTSSFFDQQTANHKTVAVLPAEMIFTGKQPENLSTDDLTRMEEFESKNFQQALYNSILRYANSKKYFTRVNLQDLVMTEKLLKEHNISGKGRMEQRRQGTCQSPGSGCRRKNANSETEIHERFCFIWN